MPCFKLSKRNFLKLTFSLLTAFIILLGGIDHADAGSVSYTGYSGGDDHFNIDLASTTFYNVNSDYGLSENAIGGGTDTFASVSYLSQTGTSTGFSISLPRSLSGSNVWLSLKIPSTGDNTNGWFYYIHFLKTGGIWVYSDDNFLIPIYGCMDNMAVNYDPTATVESGGCYYVLPDEVATSTRIISFSFSTTTNTLDLSYYIATSTPVSLYSENRNERDGVINSAFSTTTTGLTELKNIPVTLPNPLNGAGYTYLTAKLVLASDHGVIYDWHTLTIDLYNGIDLGGGGYQQEECGITHLGGCFMNGLAVMFYPSQSAFNNFNTFVELIKTKPPVGYFYVVKNNLDNLNSTTTSAFNVTIPAHIKDYLFTPFDVGIGGILWFFFAMNFYKRLKHITV